MFTPIKLETRKNVSRFKGMQVGEVRELGAKSRAQAVATLRFRMKKYVHEGDEGECSGHRFVHQFDPITSKPPRKKADLKFSKLRRSSAPTEIPSRKSFSRSSPPPCSEDKSDNKEDDFMSDFCRFKLGQVARDSYVATRAPRESLIRIARLKVNEGAFIKRSGDDWTYATLKARVMGDDPHLVFTVNEKGSTKSFPMSHWAKNIRLPESGCSARSSVINRISRTPKDDQAMVATGNVTHLKSFFSALKAIQVDIKC